MKTTIERGTFYLLLSNLIFFLTGYAIYFGLGRLFDPALFGVYGVIISLVSVITVVLSDSIQLAVSRFVSRSEKKAQAILGKALTLHLIIGFIAFIAYFLLSDFIAFLLNDQSLAFFIRLSSPVILFFPLFSVFLGYFNGLRHFKRQAMLNSFYYVAKLVFVLGLVVIGFGLLGAVMGFIIASFIALVLGLMLAKGIGTKTKAVNAIEILKFEMPLIGAIIVLHLLNNMDLFFVKALTPAGISSALSGYYLAASTLARMPQLIVLAVSMVLFPLISGTTFKKNLRKTRFYIQHALRYALLVLVPLAFLFASTSKELISLTYTSAYIQGSTALSILVFGAAFYSIFLILSTIISGSGKPGTTMLFSIIVLLVDFILNFFLVPVYSLDGAAYAITISMLFGCIVAGAYVFNKFKVLVSIASTTKIILASIILFLASNFWQLTGILLLAKYIALILLFLVILIALKELTKKDLEVFQNMLRPSHAKK